MGEDAAKKIQDWWTKKRLGARGGIESPPPLDDLSSSDTASDSSEVVPPSRVQSFREVPISKSDPRPQFFSKFYYDYVVRDKVQGGMRIKCRHCSKCLTAPHDQMVPGERRLKDNSLSLKRLADHYELKHDKKIIKEKVKV